MDENQNRRLMRFCDHIFEARFGGSLIRLRWIAAEVRLEPVTAAHRQALRSERHMLVPRSANGRQICGPEHSEASQKNSSLGGHKSEESAARWADRKFTPATVGIDPRGSGHVGKMPTVIPSALM
jgi:hypothetical protein